MHFQDSVLNFTDFLGTRCPASKLRLANWQSNVCKQAKFHTSDFPMTLAKSFFAKSLVDCKGLEFYHRY